MAEVLTGKRRTAAELASFLRREIVEGRLQKHDRLPSERVLAEAHSVARGTLREALSKLEKQGYVEIRAGSGTYVAFDGEEQADKVIESVRPLELMDARFALEPHICRLAVLHATNRDLDRGEALLLKMDGATKDPDLFAELDTEFHTLLVECAGNTLLDWMIGKINAVRSHDQWAYMRNLTLDLKTIKLYNRQHRLILNAIREREPERAAALMKEHIEAARLSLTRAASI